jgi:hypothetical protein
VYLPDKPQRQRKRCCSVQPVVHRPDIVDDLLDILGKIAGGRVELECEDIMQTALRALDLRAVDRFPAHVHCEEEIRVGHELGNCVKPTDGLIGAGEERNSGALHMDRWVRRQIGWNEGPISRRLAHVPSAALTWLLQRNPPYLRA